MMTVRHFERHSASENAIVESFQLFSFLPHPTLHLRRMIQAAAKSDCIGSGMGPLDSFLLGLLEGLHTLARAFILNEISVDDVTVIPSGRDSSHGTGRSCA